MSTAILWLLLGLLAGWMSQSLWRRLAQVTTVEAAQLAILQQTIQEQNLQLRLHDHALERLHQEWGAVMRVLSHQLKNPLSMMLSGLRMLKDRRLDLSSQRGQDSLALLEQYGVESVEWVDSLVWLSRSAESHPTQGQVDMQTLLTQVHRFLEAEGTLQAEEIALPATLPSVQGFEGWAEELFKRLFRCSRHWSPEKRWLEVQTSENTGHHRFVLHVETSMSIPSRTSGLQALHEIGDFSLPQDVSLLIIQNLASNLGGSTGLEVHPSTSSNDLHRLAFWVELPTA